MARCPYAPHRLVLSDQGSCGRCGGDVRLFAALRWLPELLFNDAHRLLEQGEGEAAAAVLQRVLGSARRFPRGPLADGRCRTRKWPHGGGAVIPGACALSGCEGPNVLA